MIFTEPIEWTTPYAGTPLEPSVLLMWSNNPEGLGNPQETTPVIERDPQRLYGSGLRCPRYSPASKPEVWAVRESLMLEAKQRAAGSSPAGGNATPHDAESFDFVAAIVQLVRTLDCESRGRGFKSH
jgi:hypothetical protein